ncbi:MAG: arginase family protein [Pseudomonadota bacterium]
MKAIKRPYVGIPTFLRSPHSEDPADYAKAAAVALGVPFDEGSPFLPGSRMGPRSIRENTLRFPTDFLYDPENDEVMLEHELTNRLILDAGDVDVRPANAPRTFELITHRVKEIVASGTFPIVIGGDHSITYPVFAAFDRPLYVVQFDAHQDYSEIDEDLARTNSHAFRHITQMDTCKKLVQVGIRGIRTTKHHVDQLRAGGHDVVPMRQARALGPDGIAALVPEGAAVFVTIDVDALDMTIIPGCVSGEPDGFGYGELMLALRRLAERCDIVGFDFVEVNPTLDVGTGATSYVGALVVTNFLGYIAAQPRWDERMKARGLK